MERLIMAAPPRMIHESVSVRWPWRGWWRSTASAAPAARGKELAEHDEAVRPLGINAPSGRLLALVEARQAPGLVD